LKNPQPSHPCRGAESITTPLSPGACFARPGAIRSHPSGMPACGRREDATPATGPHHSGMPARGWRGSEPSTDFALLIAMLLMLVRLTALWIVLPLSVTWGILTLWRGWDKRGHVSDMHASSSLPSASSTSPQEKPDAGEAAEEKPESGEKDRTKPDGLKRLNLGKPGCGRTVT